MTIRIPRMITHMTMSIPALTVIRILTTTLTAATRTSTRP